MAEGFADEGCLVDLAFKGRDEGDLRPVELGRKPHREPTEPETPRERSTGSFWVDRLADEALDPCADPTHRFRVDSHQMIEKSLWRRNTCSSATNNRSSLERKSR